MLHKLGSVFFLLAIITSFFKLFYFINKKTILKLHIITGVVSTLAMIIYSVVDFFKDKEITILPVGIVSILIILSGTKKIRKKYKWMHLTSVVVFVATLSFHIIS